MGRETQTKAIAGAGAAVVASFIPLLVSILTGSGVSGADLSQFTSSLSVLSSSAIALLVGWASVYFAPRNKPIDGV